MKIKHDVNKWFETSTKNYVGKTFLDFFESETNYSNLEKKAKIQKSIAKNWDFNVRGEVNKVCSMVAQKIINAISYWKDMKIKPWELLGEDTQDYLRQAVCAAFRKITKNREIDERTNASNINLGTISINADNTNWLNASDMIGSDATKLVEMASLDDYEWIPENKLVKITQTGTIQTIAKSKIEDIPDLGQFMEVI